jgi:inosine/xanthosine triphosphate pyrophosphatase family protein
MFAEADAENTYIGRTSRFHPNMHDANTNIPASRILRAQTKHKQACYQTANCVSNKGPEGWMFIGNIEAITEVMCRKGNGYDASCAPDICSF